MTSPVTPDAVWYALSKAPHGLLASGLAEQLGESVVDVLEALRALEAEGYVARHAARWHWVGAVAA